MDPLVSIIIPVYNAEAYIEETIHSALAQTWENIEIIIIDDGSTDNSPVIIKKNLHKKIKYIRQANKGASAARNTGINLSAGDYLQFLDADDLLSENKIKAQLNELNGYPGHIALCGTAHFQNGEYPLAATPVKEWFSAGSGDPVDFLIKLYGGLLVGQGYGGMIQPNAWLVPKTIIDKAGFWNEGLALDDDGEYFCRVVLASDGVRYNADAINYYRKYRFLNSLSALKTRKAFEDLILSNDLKYACLKRQTSTSLLEPIFGRLYCAIAVATYPQYKGLSKKAIARAEELGYRDIRYEGGAGKHFFEQTPWLAYNAENWLFKTWVLIK